MFGFLYVSLTALAFVGMTDAASKGSEVKDDPVYQKFKAEKSIRCSDNVGTGKQDDKLLNTQAKRDAFKQKLSAAEVAFFDQLVSNTDYSVDSFTGDQLLGPMRDVITAMDTTKMAFFFNMKSTLDVMPFDTVLTFFSSVPPQNLLLLKKEALTDLLGRLDEAGIKEICDKVADDSVIDSEMATALYDRSPECIAMAWKTRATDAAKNMLSGAKGAYMYEKLQQTIPSAEWDVDALMLAPDVLTVELVNKVPDSKYCISAKRDKLAASEFYSMLQEDVQKAIAQKLAKCSDMSDLNTWDSAKLNTFKIYLVNMPKSLLKSVTIDKVMEGLDSFLALDEKKVGVMFRTLAPKFKAYWTTNTATLTADQKTKILCVIMKYAPMKSFLKKTVDIATLKQFVKDAKTQCSSMKFDSRELSMVMKRITGESGFTWDATAVTEFGPSIAALPSSVIDAIPDATICGNWDKVKSADFQIKDLKKLWTKCKAENSYDLTSFNKAKLLEVGVFLKVMSSTEIATIPATALVEAAEEIGTTLNDVCKKNKAVCRAFWKQMKTDGSKDMADLMKKFKNAPEFSKMIDVSDTANMDMTSLGGMDSAANIDGSGKTASAVLKSMKRIFGEMSADNANYTGQNFKKVASMFIMGGRNEDIRNLPEDSTFVDAIKSVDIDSLPQKKQKLVQDKLVKIFGLDTNTDVCLEPSIAEEAAPFFASASAQLLKKLQPDSLRGIFKGLGKDFSALKKNTRDQAKMMTSAMTDTDNVRSKSEITMADVAKYGPYMWCGMDRDTVAKFSWEALETFMEDIAECATVHMDRDTKKALVDRITSLASSNSVNLLEDPDRLVSMRSLIMQFAPTIATSAGSLSNDNKEKLAAATSSIFEGLTMDREMKQKRNSKELGANEDADDLKDIKQLASVLMEMIKASNAMKRRRRATDTLTCEDIEPFNGELSHLTADQIDSMDGADFVNCLAEFQTTKFEDDVKAKLAAKLKEGINTDTAQWNDDNIIAAGHLLDVLDDADIDKLLLTNEAAAGIAEHLFEKKEKIMDRYLTHTSQTDTSTISSDTLTSLGNLACGFTDSHISSLTAQHVSDASADLGNVLCFKESQLTGLGSKIAEIKGNDWTSTDPEVVAGLGPLAGGLPENVLEDFTEDMIGSMTKEAIAGIPSSVFASVFTAEKMAYLSSEQANEVTDAQKDSLSDLQKTILSQLSTLTVDQLFNKAGMTSTFSLGLMIITTAAWMML